MRLIAGGAWHNILLYMTCIVAGTIGAGDLWGWWGYENTKTLGRVVLGFDAVIHIVYIFPLISLTRGRFTELRTKRIFANRCTYNSAGRHIACPWSDYRGCMGKLLDETPRIGDRKPGMVCAGFMVDG